MSVGNTGLRQLARRLSGTEAVVRNLSDHLRAERELIQAQADRQHGETLLAIEALGELVVGSLHELGPKDVGQENEAIHRIEELVGRLAERVTTAAGTTEGGALAPRAGTAEPDTAVIPEANEDQLDRCGVFCVGSARSGTTILMHCLNRSPRVHVVGECNSYRHVEGENFRRHFNERMSGMGNPRYKGTWLPDLAVDPSEPRRYFAALSRSFEFVGEKLAFGPESGLEHYLEKFLDWQSRYHLRSSYFCTVREPRACVWSMCKMFPQIDRRHICRTWLLTAGLIIDLYRAFPNAYVIFNEDFGESTVARIGEILGVEFDLSQDMISSRHVFTRVDEDVPASLRPVEQELVELEDIYREMRVCFDSVSLREDSGRFMIPVFGTLRRRIDGLAVSFDERDAEELVGPSAVPPEPRGTLGEAPSPHGSPAGPVGAADTEGVAGDTNGHSGR